MSSQARIAALVAVLGLLLVMLWTLFSPPTKRETAPQHPTPTPVAEGGATIQATVATVREGGVQAPPVEVASAPAEREAVQPAIDAITGALLVRAVWADDKTPAADIVIEIWRSGADGRFERPRLRTDADGLARCDDLAPAKVYAVVRRGDSTWGPEVQIVAGQQAQTTIEIEAGMNCRGIVVDERDQPVADAEVLAADWGGGEAIPLARTATDGTFALRAVDAHCHIGARAAGYAASSLRQFTASKGAEIEFKIVLAEKAVELDGVVVDPRQRPVAGAIVRAGDTEQRNHTLPDGARAMGSRPDTVRTDALGKFRFHYLPAGKLPLAVRAEGLAPWQQELELQPRHTNTIHVQLEAGVTLIGTVRDAAGKAVAKADIRIGDWDELGHRSVRSDADGAFRVDGLSTGSLKVNVESDAHGKAETVLQASAGQTVRWDAVLSSGLELRGRVLDAEGLPAKDTMVEAMLVHGTRERHWWAHENTDDDGRFVLRNCIAGAPIRVLVRRKSSFPEVRLANVVPGPDELVIRLPKEAWVHIQGKVLGPDGEAVPNVHASPSMKGGMNSPAETVDAATGEFRYGPYPPGEYALRFEATGYPVIRVPWRTLAPDEVWDLGAMRFQQGGTLHVALVAQDTELNLDSNLAIRDQNGQHVDRLEVKDGFGTAGPLAPGSYSLQVTGRDVAAAVQTFEVRAGLTTRLDVPVRKGAPLVIECELPAGIDAVSGGVDIAITDAAGNQVLRGTAWAREGRPELSLALLPGSYRIAASRDGCAGTAVVDVSAATAKIRAVVTLTTR